MVTIAILINVVIGGVSGEDLKWFALVTVWLQVSDCSFADYLEQNTAVYAPITLVYWVNNCNCYDYKNNNNNNNNSKSSSVVTDGK